MVIFSRLEHTSNLETTSIYKTARGLPWKTERLSLKMMVLCSLLAIGLKLRGEKH